MNFRSSKLYESGKAKLRSIKSEKRRYVRYLCYMYRSQSPIDRSTATFIPKINFHSRTLAMSKGRNIYQTEENLLNYEKKRKESLKRKIEEKENREIEQYRFHPTLIPSKSLYKQYSLGNDSKSIHKRLYEQAAIKQKKIESKLASERLSFKPQLVPSASEPQLERPKGSQKLVKTLHKWKDELEQKILEKRKMQEEALIDDNTGQRLFQPKINDTNVYSRGKDVFKYLYSLHGKAHKKAQLNKENEFLVDRDLTCKVSTSYLTNRNNKNELKKSLQNWRSSVMQGNA